MNVSTKISVDLTRNSVGARVYAVQGDSNTRCVEIQLLAGGEPWIPTGEYEASVAYVKPDGTKGIYNKLPDESQAVTVSGSTVTIVLAQQMLTASGTVRASVVFSDAKLDQLTSFPFVISVARNQFAPAEQSMDYIRLQWLEDKLDEWVQQMMSTEKAVAAAAAAERADAAADNAQEQAAAAGSAATAANTAAALANQAKTDAETAASDAASAAEAANAAAGTAQTRAAAAEEAAVAAHTAALGADAARDTANTAADAANQAAAAAQGVVETIAPDVQQLKAGISALGDRKISKFYTNSLGKTVLNDSDNGRITDICIFGRSVQDGTPTPEAPVEIQSVVNPVVTISGKNLLNCTLGTTEQYGVTFTVNGDGTYTLNGTATSDIMMYFSQTADIVGTGSIKANVFILSGSYQGEILHLELTPQFGGYNETPIGTPFTLLSTTYALFRVDIKKETTCNHLVIGYMVADDVSVWEPYQCNTASIPYTLNAIPVPSGGNVTMDGQQYIADYVDVENRRIVRNVVAQVWTGEEEFTQLDQISGVFKLTSTDYALINPGYTESPTRILCDTFSLAARKDVAEKAKIGIGIYNSNTIVLYPGPDIETVDAFKAYLSEHPVCFMCERRTPVFESVPDDQIAGLQSLRTYYGGTNISFATENGVEPVVNFDYACSLEDFVEYIKAAQGDDRKFIYDMDERMTDAEYMAAMAYVNSEYAAALTELEG